MPRDMTQLEMSEWKARLDHADRVWSEAGLLSTEMAGASGAARHPNVVAIDRYLSDYRGDQDMPFAGAAMSDQDRVVNNVTFAITNSIVALLSGRDPEPIVKAKGSTLSAADSSRKARLVKLVLRMILRESKYKREADRALLSGALSPFGLVRHGYTPDILEYTDGDVTHSRFKNERPDFPWIRFVRPWDVRIDPLANNFDPDQEARWVAFRDVYTELEIKKNPNLINRKDLRPTFTPGVFLRQPGATSRASDIAQHKLYEVWTIYDANERSWFAVSPGSDKNIREKEEWPIEWGQLPYSILTMNPQIDSPIGIPFPKLYAHEQAMINRVWTILNTVISRTRRVIFVNSGAFSQNQDQLENLLDGESLQEFIVTDGDPNVVANQMGIGQIDNSLLGLLFQLREAIREVVGVSSFDRGQRANVETAAEAGAIMQGSMVQKSRPQERFEGFWQNAIETTYRAMTQIRDDRQLVIPLVDEQMNTDFSQNEVDVGSVQSTASDLSGDFDIAVRLNSTLPLDTSQEFARAAGLYQLLGGGQSNMINQHPVSRILAELAEQDPDAWIPSLQQIQAQAESAQQGKGPDGQAAAIGETQGGQSNVDGLLSLVGDK